MKIKVSKILNLQNILVSILLSLAFFLRIYRINDILGFYYDQGRDALIIWDLWHKGKLFLIGPTTGIAGIFRGPFYYYLIAPFYLLGRGNPVYPAVFLAFLTVLATWILYRAAKKYIDAPTAILVTILSSLSFYIVMASRWLSNPTPMLILSALLLWLMVLVTRGKKWAWVPISFIVGSSIFHFGSAAEIFYIPAVLIFAIWQHKNLPNIKIFTLSFFAFILTIAPLVLFDLRHEGILNKNIFSFTLQEKSFAVPSVEIIKERFVLYSDIFANNIFHGASRPERVVLGILIISFIIFLPKLVKKDTVKILGILLLSGTIGLLFFQGNNGVIYDYYLTGYFLPFIFLAAVVLGYLWKFRIGKIFVLYFIYIFLTNNLSVTWYKISDKGTNENSVTYLNQKKAIDWVYENSKGQDFNVDIYVPPVIPYAYDYLFLWYGGKIQGRQPLKENISLLYTLYEVDPPHPERLHAWLLRQKGIAKVESQTNFGGITVQRRNRIIR